MVRFLKISKVATEVFILKRGTSINPFRYKYKGLCNQSRVRESVMKKEGIRTLFHPLYPTGTVN